MEKFPETVQDFLDGQILLINKPLGWTSFDVVKKIKNLIRTKTESRACRNFRPFS